MPPLIPTTASAAPSIVRASAGAVRRVAAQQQPSQVAGAAIATTASFSTTANRPKFSAGRRAFRLWESRVGRDLRRHKVPGKPSYLPAPEFPQPERQDEDGHFYPFPLNPHYRSNKVLDDRSRELIWSKIMQEGETIKAVSAEFGVDIRRVAAIVRLKEVEKDWIAKVSLMQSCYSLPFL